MIELSLLAIRAGALGDVAGGVVPADWLSWASAVLPWAERNWRVCVLRPRVSYLYSSQSPYTPNEELRHRTQQAHSFAEANALRTLMTSKAAQYSASVRSSQ